MNPRGRPFEPGNKLGRGRPKGSRNKSKAAVLQLLEQSEIPVVAQVIRQAMKGHFGSQRLLMAIYPTLPRRQPSRTRVGKMQSIEDLVSVAEQTTQQMIQGDITPEEAKVTMQGVEQLGHLLKQRTEQHQLQRPPKAPMPEFMRAGLEAARQICSEEYSKAKNEREALQRDGAKPP
jgi:hypothetical protein